MSCESDRPDLLRASVFHDASGQNSVRRATRDGWLHPARWLYVDVCMAGDYCPGSAAGNANMLAFAREHRLDGGTDDIADPRDAMGDPEDASTWWAIVSGGYGSRMLIIDADNIPLEALEWLAGLEEYPLLCEETYSEVETDMAFEDLTARADEVAEALVVLNNDDPAKLADIAHHVGSHQNCGIEHGFDAGGETAGVLIDRIPLADVEWWEDELYPIGTDWPEGTYCNVVFDDDGRSAQKLEFEEFCSDCHQPPLSNGEGYALEVIGWGDSTRAAWEHAEEQLAALGWYIGDCDEPPGLDSVAAFTPTNRENGWECGVIVRVV